MNIKIEVLPSVILNNCLSDEQMEDSSFKELTLQIKKLQLAIELNNTIVNIDERYIVNNQVFIKEYNIWLQPDEFKHIL